MAVRGEYKLLDFSLRLLMKVPSYSITIIYNIQLVYFCSIRWCSGCGPFYSLVTTDLLSLFFTSVITECV